MDAVSVWNKYLTGKTTSLYQVLYRTANAVSNVTGVAVSAALRDVKGVYDTLTGLAGADDPLGMDKDLNRIALALDGGEDGLMFYRAIVRHWTQILRPGGWLMFEVGEDQADAVMALMTEEKYTDVTALEDTAGIRRVVVGRI